MGDLLRRGAAADVEKVRRTPAVQGDGVHRGHGEPGAVDDAAGVAVEGNIIKPVRGGLDFLEIGKFAGRPPCRAMASIVAMASPAPLTMQPVLPSRAI